MNLVYSLLGTPILPLRDPYEPQSKLPEAGYTRHYIRDYDYDSIYEGGYREFRLWLIWP